MLENFLSHLKKSFDLIRNNHQLAYTIVVALVIFAAFALVTVRFSGIAQQAQERLSNVRAGSIQDAFVVFAPDVLHDFSLLEKRMASIANINETIVEFRVIRFFDDRPIVIAALDAEVRGKEDTDNLFLLNQALVNPGSSVTIKEIENGERFFRTARAIVSEKRTVLGVVMLRQTLSEADRQINNSIRSSIILFLFIVVAIMVLFFRYAKIIDYAVLYRRLKEIDQLKDDFIAMASHELRTPLTIIRGYIELLIEAKGLTKKEHEYANTIDLSAKQLNTLIVDMLDVSRIEQGRMKFNIVEVNVTEITSSIVDTFKPTAEGKQLGLSFEGESVSSMLDSDRFRQVLINIIGNAVKYTKEGDVKVAVTTKNDTIEIRVSDTGLGISAKSQKRLFEKFYRVKTKDTGKIQGTGLGLWLSKALIEKMNGSISVESIEGVGTHFIVVIPRMKK